jgi:hypothetical protein
LARNERRQFRERLAQALAVVKAAQKAGLPVTGGTVEGVQLEFGALESAKAALTPLEAWKSRRIARSA